MRIKSTIADIRLTVKLQLTEVTHFSSMNAQRNFIINLVFAEKLPRT